MFFRDSSLFIVILMLLFKNKKEDFLMSSAEQELKDLIIKKYGNLSKFCEVIDMPWTTLDSILKRGVSKANISNIMKITQELNIDTDSLAVGLIAPKKDAIPIAFLPI